MSIDIRNITGMHGPFAAPINARPQLLRGRLLERLQARWSVPVVSIVAGAEDVERGRRRDHVVKDFDV